MKTALYAFAFLVLLAATFLAIILVETWRAKKTQRQLKRDHDWRMWAGQVRARLENIEGSVAPYILDREKEWFHEVWEWGHSADAAIEKWLAERKVAE